MFHKSGGDREMFLLTATQQIRAYIRPLGFTINSPATRPINPLCNESTVEHTRPTPSNATNPNQKEDSLRSN